MPDETPSLPAPRAERSRDRADLHLHTNFSDGTETPERVVELAHQAGLRAIAITDHDTTEATALAADAAARYGIELLPGIEMSASVDGLEVHLLGFLMELAHRPLVEHLTRQQARRVQRVHEMVSRLQRIGVRIEAAEVFELAGRGTVGRPHVARVLLRHGYVATLAEAFSTYLGPENPGFVPGSPVPPADIIRLIRGAGGIPVLAHPVYLKRDGLIEGLAAEGLVGLEVYHAGHVPEMVRHYEALADRCTLLRTGGSDYHGDAKEGAPIGVVTIPYSLVEALKRWKATHHP